MPVAPAHCCGDDLPGKVAYLHRPFPPAELPSIVERMLKDDLPLHVYGPEVTRELPTQQPW